MGKHSSPGPVDGMNVNPGFLPGVTGLPDHVVFFVHGVGRVEPTEGPPAEEQPAPLG